MPTQPDETQMMILVSNVIIIANQLRAQDRDKGITRVGGDYYADAAKLIYSERAKVFQALGRRGA
jgi:hypothetical protein